MKGEWEDGMGGAEEEEYPEEGWAMWKPEEEEGTGEVKNMIHVSQVQAILLEEEKGQGEGDPGGHGGGPRVRYRIPLPPNPPGVVTRTLHRCIAEKLLA